MRGWRLVLAGVGAVAMLWLMRTPAPPRPLYPIEEPRPPATDFGTAFDAAKCGSVSGRVLWGGPEPTVESIVVFRAFAPPANQETVPNPNAPRINAGGLADAVVWLRPVDLKQSKKCDLPPVVVEIGPTDFVVRQGDRSSKVGIVRCGEAVDFVSREAKLHSARGRGAAFFTQMLPDPDKPVRRTLSESGVVELSSGSAYYWMRAYLVVSDHPYVAVTEKDGSFALIQVPDGEYELVCWKANWHVERLEYDPEAFGPARLVFRPAVEKRTVVRVAAGRSTDASFTCSAPDFLGAQ
jgi:hypothetical protein